jgi:hypothetical protein
VAGLPDATWLPLDAEGAADDELLQAASTATAHPAAPAPRRRFARRGPGTEPGRRGIGDVIGMAFLLRAPSGLRRSCSHL